MQPQWVVRAASCALLLVMATASPGQEVKLSDCPAPVRKTIELEARGAKIDSIQKEMEGDETIYWAEAKIGGKPYAIGVLEDGTLSEMNLAFDDSEVTLERCPSAVQAVLRRESFGEKLAEIGKDMRYGSTVYATVIQHRGKAYEIVVAEDGTLVEKVLVIEDEEIDLAKCPAAVQAALKQHAAGGAIGDITRSTGILRPTFEAEVTAGNKVYLIEVTESGLLITKSLEAGEE